MFLCEQKQDYLKKSSKMVTKYTLRKYLTGVNFAVSPVIWVKSGHRVPQKTSKTKKCEN